jgi:heme O synthase-like polyprenyltransferase
MAAACGVTGSMFAVEGTVLNGYLVYLASRFHEERTNENARRVFRCSLYASHGCDDLSEHEWF